MAVETAPRDVALLCSGRELLKGNTLDRNAHWLAGRVERCGLRCWRFSVVDDVPAEIEAELGWVLGRGTRYLITTGGLGPTFDAMTIRCLAGGLGLPLRRDPLAEAQVAAAYQYLHARGLTPSPQLTTGPRKMALRYLVAAALRNPCGAAPGIRLEPGGAVLFSPPGVPEEMPA